MNLATLSQPISFQQAAVLYEGAVGRSVSCTAAITFHDHGNVMLHNLYWVDVMIVYQTNDKMWPARDLLTGGKRGTTRRLEL